MSRFKSNIKRAFKKALKPFISNPPAVAGPAVAQPQSAQKQIPENIRVAIPLNDVLTESLVWLDRTAPEVTIVIVSYQRPDLVENLLQSILLFSQGFKYEIIVVDNGSPEGTHRLSPFFAKLVRVVSLQSNKYIGDAYNIGVEKSRGRYVILMNNDIVVLPGWLENLISPLAGDDGIGVVGPKFLYPDGRLQEAGALIDRDGFSIQLGKRGNADAPEFNEARIVDYCTGATMAVRRDQYLSQLGYSWIWAPGYYEDVDLCFKLRECGLKVLYNPKAVVYHIESATMSTLPPSSNMMSAVQVNRERFVGLWGAMLTSENDHFKKFNDAALEKYQEAVATDEPIGTRVGIYMPYEFVPGGGENYILSVAKSLPGEKTIYLVFPEEQSILRVISVLSYLDLSELSFRVTTYRKAAEINLDIFLSLGNSLFPEIKGLGKKNFYDCQFPFSVPVEYLRDLHNQKNHESYDAYFAASEFIKKHINQQAGDWHCELDVRVLYPPINIIGAPSEDKQNHVIGVGRFFAGGHNKRHDKMIEAFGKIMETAGQKTSPALKDVELHLAGAVHAGEEHRAHFVELKRLAENKPINFHTNVLRPDLKRLYQQSKVYWHAAGWDVDVHTNPAFAEHLGITILEGMSAGCVPVVYGVGGPVEIVHHEVNGFIIASIDEMVDKTLYILENWDEPAMRKMRDAALASAQKFSKTDFPSKVVSVFNLAER